MGGGGGKRLGVGGRKDIFCLKREGGNKRIGGLLINNLPQTGKMFLHWFDGNQFLKFPANGMAFKVSCGGCHRCYGASGYKSSLKK